MLGAHHKTGTFLFQSLRDKLKEFHTNQCRFGVAVYTHISAEQIMSIIHHRLLNKVKSKSDRSIFVLNIIRDQFDTILSAYNYHYHTTNRTEWVNYGYNLDVLRAMGRTKFNSTSEKSNTIYEK